ncbi:MAG TPA: response regulator [Rhizomicrobium sp.]|jgi:signal transduction histidine kinase/CheY-like chemotaxis protein
MPIAEFPLPETILNVLDNGVVVLNKDKHVQTWNNWFSEASKIQAEQASGRLLSEIFPAAKSSRLNSAIDAAFASGVSSLLTHSLHRVLFPLKTAAGFEMVHDVSVRPIGLKGNRVCLLQILDVTVAHQRETVLRNRYTARYDALVEATDKIKAMEEQLRQSQKMEAVGQLTGGIAHDFNNLLQGIIGSLDRVQFRIAEGRINDVDRFLKGAVASANRAAALTHRLLAFSRRQPVDPKPVNANVLIRSIEELLRRSMGETVVLKTDLAPDLAMVRCDTNQLENALLNLVINARDAMPDGGDVKITTANIALDEKAALGYDVPEGRYISLRVNDSGVGMPADVKSRAFDPFFTTKPIGQGTGLGLSMIYGFVRQSEGGIRIDSAPGKGTSIEICLPRFDGAAEPDSPDKVAPEGFGTDRGEIVLVVEDEAVVRLLVVETLQDLGYRVLEAADGQTALRILQSGQRVDLLVTDIGLPTLNGRQLADAGRTTRPTLKILFMTGYAENAASNNFLSSGMEIITKPFEMDALAKRVRKMLEIPPS